MWLEETWIYFSNSDVKPSAVSMFTLLTLRMLIPSSHAQSWLGGGTGVTIWQHTEVEQVNGKTLCDVPGAKV